MQSTLLFLHPLKESSWKFSEFEPVEMVWSPAEKTHTIQVKYCLLSSHTSFGIINIVFGERYRGMNKQNFTLVEVVKWAYVMRGVKITGKLSAVTSYDLFNSTN